MSERVEKARAALDLVMAYQRVFFGEDGKVSPDARAVFRDLSAFCQIGNPHQTLDSTGRIDPLAAVSLVSRAEVYSHIERRLMTSVAELNRIIAEGSHE